MSSNKRTLRFAVSTLLLAPLLGGCPDNGGTTPEEPTSNTTRSMMPPEDPTPNSGPFDEVESEPDVQADEVEGPPEQPASER